MNSALILFIGIVQGILFFAHFIVYKAVLFFGNIDGKAALITKLSFFGLSVFFMIGSIITAQGYSFAGRSVYTVAAIWLGVLFWLFSMAVIGSIVWYILANVFPAFSAQIHARQSFGLILLTIVLAINIYGVINAQFIQTKKYNIVIPNIPEAWWNRKIVFIADTHFGNIWNVNTAKRIVEKVEKMDPEIILISGDFFDGPKINFDEVAQVFAPLVKSTHGGIYFVTGNHEEYQDKEMYLKPLRDAGFIILDSNSVLVNGLRIAGISYGDSTTPEKQLEAMKKIRAEINADKNEAYASEPDQILAETKSKEISDAPIIFLKHTPLLLSVAADAGVALQLSGHTHRGQMWPFSIITKKIYKGFDYGLKTYSSDSEKNMSEKIIPAQATPSEAKTMQVLTTSGAGSWGPPQRFGTASEIVEITIVKPF